jgi:hypothetical protein
MAQKPDGKQFPVSEQIFSDQVTGIKFQFFCTPSDQNSPFRLRLFGNLPYGDHELIFDAAGVIRARETIVETRPAPSWLKLT